MAKSNGIKSLKQAAKLLNKHAPKGESLAYINSDEGRLLKAHGGSGIMTVAGVPSYAWYNPFSWDWSDSGTAGKVWNYITGRYEDQDPLYKDGRMIDRGQSGVGNLVQDAISIYGFLRAKKDQEGLNEAETAEFNRLQAQLTASQEQFTEYTDAGSQLKAPTNVPTTISDVAQFTETTGRPDMITTAVAEGGRIGYNLGGIGAMDPRMGYNTGDIVEKTFSEGVEQQFPSDPLGAINVNEEQMAIISDMNNRGMDTSLISTMSGVDEDTVKRYIRILNAQAQGGRIGAKEGGIMPLLNLGGMEKDYRQDGGFVPIGRREKADDVPARLSKNEFVFTADAVRAAGGGDIDQGAQRMYNVMKNLEAGGEISEQSQGKA